MLVAAGELHLWKAGLDREDWPPADALPAPDRERAAQMRRPPTRRRWVAARWALRSVLGRYLDEEPAAVELGLGPRGKPILAEPHDALQFNLSHSGELALVAVARGLSVGVDVERIAPRRDVLALARRALGPAEAKKLAEIAPQERSVAFHAAWARREAIAKCLGVGLGAPLPKAAVAVSELDAEPGFAAAVAVSGDEVPPLRRFAIEPSPSAA